MYYDIYSYLCARNLDGVQIAKRDIFSLMLLVVVMFNLTSTTLFIHRHIIDERTIVHSHPFSGSPESHSHSTSSLDIIARQATTEALASSNLSVECSVEYVEFGRVVPIAIEATSLSVAYQSLRAPPVA